ncbi:DUF1643 domain-containing protein [Aerococcaceae bacterium NML190073]|nr:DUF1643 domain-containing protein [Aerococcaceae bacterium NML190073]
MVSKITTVRPKYPVGQEPTICIPTTYSEHHRFLLGRLGANPLVAVCMNPSAASEAYSDRTINRIITASERLGKDGWIVVNVYPERATNAALLEQFNPALAEQNCAIIIDFLQANRIDEVWGAWGDLHYAPLVEGKQMLLAALKQHHIKIYHFASLSKAGEPRHPLSRAEKLNLSEAGKVYLDY